MQKISNTEIRCSLEQYRIIETAWLNSKLFDILKFFCFGEIKSINGVSVGSDIINWSADVNGRSIMFGLKYKNLIFTELFFSNPQKFADFIPIFVFQLPNSRLAGESVISNKISSADKQHRLIFQTDEAVRRNASEKSQNLWKII